MSDLDLFDIEGFDQSLADHPDCFDSQRYDRWEQEVCKPHLESLGFTDISFSDGERDSFGPLIRIVRATKDGKRMEFFYG